MFFVFVQDIKFVKTYSILFDQCMKAVGFQCNVARCAVGVISVCVQVLNVFIYLLSCLFNGYFIHLKNFTALFTYDRYISELEKVWQNGVVSSFWYN